MNAPLHRWAGSKRHLVERVAPACARYLAGTRGKLLSAFYGTGAIEQQVGSYDAPQVVAEACDDLRILYEEFAREGGADRIHAACWELARRLDQAGHRKVEVYLNVRAHVPEEPAGRAGRFLFLVGCAYNGLWRVNASGGHNVPPDPARLAKWNVPAIVTLKAAALNARRLELHADWQELGPRLRAGDLVISDPPYADGFDAYTAGGFSREARQVLVASLAKARAMGVAVVAFDAPSVRGLYETAGFAVETSPRSGRISSKGTGRAPVDELLITGGLEVGGAP